MKVNTKQILFFSLIILLSQSLENKKSNLTKKIEKSLFKMKTKEKAIEYEDKNLIVNGGFENPKVSVFFVYNNDIEGWKGNSIEIGKGSIYNKNFSGQVTELDASNNTSIKQILKFNESKRCKLQFEYGANVNANLDSCGIQIKFNDAIIFNEFPTFYTKNKVLLEVTTRVGNNTLELIGTGISDSYGAIVDNIQLYCVPDIYDYTKNPPTLIKTEIKSGCGNNITIQPISKSTTS